MGQGDVDVQIVEATVTAVNTAVTGMRSTTNDKWLMASMPGGQIMIVNIEEA